MENTFRFSDDFGPAQITYIHQASLALKAIVVIDNTACGAAIGGVRMAANVSADECFRTGDDLEERGRRFAARRRQICHLR